MALGSFSKEPEETPSPPPVDEILAQAQSVDDLLAQAMADPSVARMFLNRLLADTNRAEAQVVAAEPYYVGDDRRTRVDPTILRGGSVYYHHDFRTPGFKVAKRVADWVAEYGEKTYVREDEESVPFITVDGHTWPLPMNEEVTLPGNVYETLRWTNTARREAQNGRAIRRLKPDITVGFGAVNATYGEAESA